MKNLWNDIEASMFKSLLELRVYTSRLLGAESNLVLHGGGNTSVKTKEIDIFGEIRCSHANKRSSSTYNFIGFSEGCFYGVESHGTNN